MKKFISFIAGAVVIIALFLMPKTVMQGIFQGGKLCMQVLLPSIFPFMIITSFLSLTGALLLPARLLSPLFKRLGLPTSLAEVWLASFIGGYPTGGHTLSVLVQQSILSRRNAGIMLRCCVNPGPAFLVLAVGQGMMGSQHIGYMLLLSQLISSLMLCALLCRKNVADAGNTQNRTLALSDAFVTAVTGAASAMLNIFAFVLAFSVLLALLGSLDPRLTVLASSLEVTLGCAVAAQLGGKTGLLLTAFFIGFGGFSVGFQVLSLARQADIVPVGFWRGRMLAGLLNTAVFRAILLFDKSVVYTVSVNSPPIAVWSVDRLLGAGCIAAMLLLSMKKFEPTAIR